MNDPWLTKKRWQCLQAFKRQPRLMDRAFLAKELIGPKESLGFRLGGVPRMWQLTEAGREAVKNCPDTFPGEPVYGSKSK